MNRISVQIEPIPGTGVARVRSFCNNPLDKVEWVRQTDANLLVGTHLPAGHQATTAVALSWLCDMCDVVRVVIIDRDDVWQADVHLIIQDRGHAKQAFDGRGVATTPADAIRAAMIDAYHKAA
jgi:hypothetical protein